MSDDARADEIRDFWEAARTRVGIGRVAVVTGLSLSDAAPPPSWSFGDNPSLANELLAAVLERRKTATSSSVWEYREGEELPAAGDLSIILDGFGHPRALIRTTAVDVVPFVEVSEEFAFAEGEGDGSLESWRQSHRAYFSRVLGREIPNDMPVVCERFELRFPGPQKDIFGRRLGPGE